MALMLRLRLSFWVFFSLTFLPLLSIGQARVSVEDVRFAKVRPDGDAANWFEVEIEVAVPHGVDLEGPSVVRLELELAVEAPMAGDFVFMKSAVRFFLPARGKEASVYFYLPPALAESLDLRREPYGWRVTLEHAGKAVPLLPNAYSKNLREREAAQSFARRIQSEAGERDGWLQPIYLTPFYAYENGRYEACPNFLRLERQTRQ